MTRTSRVLQGADVQGQAVELQAQDCEPTTEEILGRRLFSLATKVVDACVATLGDHNLYSLPLQPVIAVAVSKPTSYGEKVSITQGSRLNFHNDIDPAEYVPSGTLLIEYSGLTAKDQARSLAVNSAGKFEHSKHDTVYAGPSASAIGDAAILCAYLEKFGTIPDDAPKGEQPWSPNNGWQNAVSVSFPTPTGWSSTPSK